MTTLACVQTAVVFRADGITDWKLGDYMSFESLQFPGELRLPLGGVVEQLVAGGPIASIELGILAKSWDYINPRQGEKFGPNVTEIYAKIATPFFVEFYEDYRLWLNRNVSTQFAKWPPEWQFARVVRNAASHNTIRIDDQGFAPVAWRSLIYGPAQNGRAIFGSDIPLADLVILMIEMDEALDALGCPSRS